MVKKATKYKTTTATAAGNMKKAIGLVKKNKIFFIRESERLGDKFYCRVKPR